MLSQDGVVGTTLKTAGDTVDVRLVVDAGSSVDVIVQRTGARGFVRPIRRGRALQVAALVTMGPPGRARAASRSILAHRH